MKYTTEAGGRLNNFAQEPKMYTAEPPTTSEKRNYIVVSIAAIVLVSGLLYVAASASSLG